MKKDKKRFILTALTKGVSVMRLHSSCRASISRHSNCGIRTKLFINQCYKPTQVAHVNNRVIILKIIDISLKIRHRSNVSFVNFRHHKHFNLSRMSTKRFGLDTEAILRERCMHSKTRSQSLYLSPNPAPSASRGQNKCEQSVIIRHWSDLSSNLFAYCAVLVIKVS